MSLNSLLLFDPATQNRLPRPRVMQGPADVRPAENLESSHGSAWQREMERAQVNNWFKPFDAGTGEKGLTMRGPAQSGIALRESNRPLPRPTLAAEHGARSVAYGENLETAMSWPSRVRLTPSSPYASDAPSLAAKMANLDGDHTDSSGEASTFGTSGDSGTALSASSEIVPVGTTSEPRESLLAKSLAEHISTALKSQVVATSDLLGIPPSSVGVPMAVPHLLPTTPVPPAPPQLAATHAPLIEHVSATSRAPLAVADGPLAGGSLALKSGRASKMDAVASATWTPTSSPSINPAIRLHTQWHADMVNIWLGMDGTAAGIASQAAVIISELQHHLGSQGQRLGRVICNGRVLFDPDVQTTPVPAESFAATFAQQVQLPSSALTPDTPMRRFQGPSAVSLLASPITSQGVS